MNLVNFASPFCLHVHRVLYNDFQAHPSRFHPESAAIGEGFEGTGRCKEGKCNLKSGRVLTQPSQSAYSVTPNLWLGHLRGLKGNGENGDYMA